MNGNDIIALGLGLQAPWEIVGQTLDTEKSPHELRLTIQARRGTRYPCPVCGSSSPEHGVKQIEVPWARKGSKFTLLFE